MKRIVVKIFLLAAIALFCASCNKAGEKEQGGEKIVSDLETADVAKYSALKDQYKGKVVIANFFASWCPPCKAETPNFVSVYNEFKNKNFIIIGFTVDESKSDAIDFVNKYGITYPVFMASKALQKHFMVQGVPTAFIYNEKGELVDMASGAIPEAGLRKIAEYAASIK